MLVRVLPRSFFFLLRTTPSCSACSSVSNAPTPVIIRAELHLRRRFQFWVIGEPLPLSPPPPPQPTQRTPSLSPIGCHYTPTSLLHSHTHTSAPPRTPSPKPLSFNPRPSSSPTKPRGRRGGAPHSLPLHCCTRPIIPVSPTPSPHRDPFPPNPFLPPATKLGLRSGNNDRIYSRGDNKINKKSGYVGTSATTLCPLALQCSIQAHRMIPRWLRLSKFPAYSSLTIT